MIARDYQLECIACIREQFTKKNKRVLVEAATGAGKTIIFSMIADMARAKGGKTLILCNRDNLVAQAAQKYKRVTGNFPSVEKADEKGSRNASVVIGSIQTMQKERLKGWNPDHFSIVITDEVHGACAPTFRAVLTHFGEAYHVGFSATVERSDGQGVGWFYKECDGKYKPFAFRRGLFDLIEEGWLVPPIFKKIPIAVTLDEKLAAKKVITEEEETFALEPYVHKLVTELGVMVRDKKTLAFFPDCVASLAASELLRGLGLESKHVQGAGKTSAGLMHEWEKDDILEWFDKVTVGVATNAQLLTTGYDNPTINAIAIIRIVKSSPLWIQMVGRGTRSVANVDAFTTAQERKDAIAASSKPSFDVLDLLIQSDNHNIVQPSCLISTIHAEQKAIEKAMNGFQQADLRLLKAALNKVKLDSATEALRTTAELAANAALKMASLRNVYIGDILLDYKAAHKPASPKFVAFIKHLIREAKVNCDLGSGPFTTYQLNRIKARIEKRSEKIESRTKQTA